MLQSLLIILLQRVPLGFRSLFIMSLFISGVGVISSPIQPLTPDSTVPDFALMDHLGRMRTLSRQTESKAVALFVHGNGCPIVRQSVVKLNELQNDYSSKGVVFAMINANTQDPLVEIRAEAEEFGIKMPILKDDTQWVARSLGLTRTGEILLIESGSWKLIYRGAIDDQLIYGGRKPSAERHFFKEALEQFLAGEKVETPQSPFKGCKLFYEENHQSEEAPVTYSKTIAPMLKTALDAISPERLGLFR